MTNLTEDLLTVPQAADALHVSVSTVRRWIESGELKGYRVGPKRVMIRAHELADLLKPTTDFRAASDEVTAPEHMSADDKRRLHAAIANSRKLRESVRLPTGMLPAWQLINEARDQRSRELFERHGQ